MPFHWEKSFIFVQIAFTVLLLQHDRHEHTLLSFIIQQIVTMPIYGKEALNICHPYMTDILRYT